MKVKLEKVEHDECAEWRYYTYGDRRAGIISRFKHFNNFWVTLPTPEQPNCFSAYSFKDGYNFLVREVNK